MIFEKKVIERKMCVLIISTTFIWNISRSKKNWARYGKKGIGILVKYPLLLSDFNKNCIFSIDFRNILKYQTSWKSAQWEPSCSMQTDRQTDKQT